MRSWSWDFDNIIQISGCATACFDHCLKKYKGSLFKGKTYFCQKGCAGLSGGQLTDSDKYCCGKNFETCKSNCQIADSRSKKYQKKYQNEVETCEYGCEFWKENYNVTKIPKSCSKSRCLLFF